MADQLPPPPVPADADLTHYDDMPLVVRRLRDSGISGEPNAEVFRCAVLLWCVAWHQLPAGSLPDNDEELCRLVGLGRDMKTWRKVRSGALRGWRRFADGRLYHKVVAEKVMEGWNRTRIKNWGLACDRQRKENKAREERREPKLPMPEKPVGIPLAWPAEDDKISAGKSESLPPENALKGIEGNGIEDISAPIGAARPGAPLAQGKLPETVDAATVIFSHGLAWLKGAAARPEKDLRSLLGKWRRDYGDAALIEALGAAQRHGPIEPVEWLTKALKERANGSGSSTIKPGERSVTAGLAGLFEAGSR